MTGYWNLSTVLLSTIVASVITPQLALGEKSAQHYFDQAEQHYDQGQLEEAIQDYTQSIELDPDLAKAYLNRGKIYYKKGELEKAIQNLNQAIEINPNLAKSYYILGKVYQIKNQFDLAIRQFTKAIKFDSKNNIDNDKVYYRRGNSFYFITRISSAIEDYTQAIKVNPENAKFYYNRGIVNKKKGKLEKAIKDLERASNIFLKQGDTKNYQKAQHTLESVILKHRVQNQTNLQQNRPVDYSIGDTITHKNWSLKVDITLGIDKVGDNVNNKQAKNIFTVILLNIKNKTSQMASIPGRFYVITEKARKIEEIATTSIFSEIYNNESIFSEEFNNRQPVYTYVPPKKSAEKIIVFDAPRNFESSKSLVLVWQPGLSNKEVYKIELD